MAENQNISSPTVNRIFIGGLGENVTTNDLKNIFNSLGKVNNVEFVRTNGRDFAYVDFKPESDKSLQKLFSIYNGCKWKGGKLRLEKAKEHYLTRLKREWEQDSVPVPEQEPVPMNPESGKEKARTDTGKLNPDFEKIGIFFPKLKKIKTLPYKGSGKHKYSFQRVELSSTLPLHFCDCEEHCDHKSVDEVYESALESAARERETNIMNSVLERLMKESEERERQERGEEGRESEERGEEKERNVMNSVMERVLKESEERESEVREEVEEEEEEEEDGDIVMNISGSKYKSEEFMLDSLLKESLENKKKSQERKREVSKEKIMENEERENVERGKDREEMEEEEESDGDIVINISSNKSDEDHMVRETLDNKKELHERNLKEKKIESTQNVEKEIEKEEEQVGEEEESDGDIFMNISSKKSDELMLDRMVKETLDNKKESQEEINEMSKVKEIQTQAEEDSLNVEQTEEKEKSSPVKKESETKIQKPNSNTWFQKSAWRDLVGDSNTNLFSSYSSTTNPKSISTHQTLISNPPKQAITQQNLSSILPKEIKSPNEESKKRKEMSKDGKSVNKEKRRVVQKVTVGEVCSFMRNEESEKEWNKTKKALSSYMKSNKSEGSNKMQGKRGE
ncbi:hypothetical protein LUZ60_009224 [Juncus effusus]|nr:hypothetical protein LUZ60_009224 [Juncus effusus]